MADERNSIYGAGPGQGEVPAGVARTGCSCMRCRSRGLMGPVVLVTLGVLFLLSEFGIAGFHRTWPILLIMIGLVKVLAGNLDTTGHMDTMAPTSPVPSPSAPPAQNPESGQVKNV